MKKHPFLAVSCVTLLLFSAVVLVQVVDATKANTIGYTVSESLTVYSLMMPEEYLSYTICWVNGSLWAKVDGTYPLTRFEVENKEDILFTFTGDVLTLVYPTPPGTTNISMKVDETDLKWSNYTQIFPAATHYTALGDWAMISCKIQPVLDQFTLKIHYEHPVERVNGSYAFLYDLNISPYLSSWSNKSTAYFDIKFETNYTDLQANTITINGKYTPADYTTTTEDQTETVTLQVVSEYNKPLLGDLLITFTADEGQQQNDYDFSGSYIPIEYLLAAATLTVIVALAGYLTLKHKKASNKNG